jgi:hypothetical protein
MNSLAYDDVQEQTQVEFTPELHLVKPRYRSLERSSSPGLTTENEEVVYISGRFTVSF